MGRWHTTLNDIGASGEPQQRSGESAPTFLARTSGDGAGAKHAAPPPTDNDEEGPFLARNLRARTDKGASNSQALLLALLLGCAIFVSLYMRSRS